MAMTTVFTAFAENKIIDAIFRAQALTAPATLYAALIMATRGYWNNVASSVVSVGDTVLPVTQNGRIYKCTTGGTASAAEPTWPTTNGGTVVDGTVTWTEQSVALLSGTYAEPVGGSYARVAITGSLANWAGTQGAGTTVASTGTSGVTSNNAAITFAAPTGNWGVAFGIMLADAASAGNGWLIAPFTNPKTINNGDAAPTVAIAALSPGIVN
jgi:hypothetical protein